MGRSGMIGVVFIAVRAGASHGSGYHLMLEITIKLGTSSCALPIKVFVECQYSA